MKCVFCDHEWLENGTVKETKRIGGISYTAELPAKICPNCNENYISIETLRKFESQIANTLIRERVKTPAAIKFLQKYFGFLLLGETTGEEK